MYNSGSSSWGNKLKSIIEVNATIYVGGEPDMVGDRQTNYVVQWDGNEWSSVASGVNDYVHTLAADSNFLYTGGRFTMAGNKGSNKLARYDISGVTSLKTIKSKIVENYYLQPNYPNPFNPNTTITYTLPKAGKVNLSVFNILGQYIAHLYSGNQKAGTYSFQWDVSAFPSGLYFYQLETNNQRQTKRMLLIK